MVAMIVSISDASARQCLCARPASFCPTARPGPADCFPAITITTSPHICPKAQYHDKSHHLIDRDRPKLEPPGQLCIHRSLDLRGDGYCVDRHRFLVAGTQQVLPPKAQLDILRRPPSKPGVNSGVLPYALVRERRNVKCGSVAFKFA